MHKGPTEKEKLQTSKLSIEHTQSIRPVDKKDNNEQKSQEKNKNDQESNQDLCEAMDVDTSFQGEKSKSSEENASQVQEERKAAESVLVEFGQTTICFHSKKNPEKQIQLFEIKQQSNQLTDPVQEEAKGQVTCKPTASEERQTAQQHSSVLSSNAPLVLQADAEIKGKEEELVTKRRSRRLR